MGILAHRPAHRSGSLRWERIVGTDMLGNCTDFRAERLDDPRIRSKQGCFPVSNMPHDGRQSAS